MPGMSIQTLCAICLFTVAGYCSLGIWFAGLRGQWRVTGWVVGPVGSAGFAMFFTSGGLLFIADAFPERYFNVLIICIFCGVIFGAACVVFDVLPHYLSSLRPPLSPQVTTPPKDNIWFLVVFGIILIIFMILLWFF